MTDIEVAVTAGSIPPRPEISLLVPIGRLVGRDRDCLSDDRVLHVVQEVVL